MPRVKSRLPAPTKGQLRKVFYHLKDEIDKLSLEGNENELRAAVRELKLTVEKLKTWVAE